MTDEQFEDFLRTTLKRDAKPADPTPRLIVSSRGCAVRCLDRNNRCGGSLACC